ncbi:hypothetical protein [Psychrobacter sp. DAB_AL62B]|uniref:hypothetical protein n=1 Tax=Psychrobacter sp. DAB_AL62B TaxID=1028420 RepID=UPI0023816E80|nr:hypothetical protein [Psychrobacter sp. DAB_AL62B]MDE4455696.1 hypothetical protein [Psychrobacter sp. DAB_AL62B]
MKHLYKSQLSSLSCLSLLGLSVTIALAGCNNIQSIDAPDTSPIHTTEYNKDQSQAANQGSINNPFTKCPPYNPEQTMCTAQYDPVCVTVKNRSGVSYRTAGNSCSACGTTAAVGYVKGQCS